jgi:serine/threonine protein kinase
LIAKIANLVAPPVLNYLAKERAALKTLSDLADITQPLLDIKPGRIASICASAILVTEFVGQYTLKDAKKRLVPDAIATAARAIGILQKVHEKGLIHGDIHFKNWVVSDLDKIPQTLRLIDFGRAELFITKDGRHVPAAKREYQPWYDLTILSPFELDGWVKTRRDDMFRLAEMFVGFFDDPPPELEESQPLELSHEPIMLTHLERKLQLGKAKRERVFTRMTPPIFIDFYTYCVNLDFSARPDYETWIEKFSSDN